MKFKGLLAAVLALAVAAGLVYWSQKREQAGELKPKADEPPKIVSVPQDQIQSIALQKEGAVTRLNLDAGKWKIVEPKPLAADQDSVTSLVSTVSSLASERLIEDKAGDLAQYGLNAPSLEVTFGKKDGKTQKIVLGDDTPTGSAVFARLDGDPRVFTVASFVKTSLDKTSQDLRDKRLLTFDSDKLTRVELNAKNQVFEFGKNNQNEWQILKPRPLRADATQVDELVRKLKDARMDTTAEGDAAKAPAAFASGVKVASASVADSAGAQNIEVRRDKDKNYWAKSSVVEGFYKVGSELGEGLDKDLDSFRNKKLFDFGWNEPSKVQVNQAVFQKSGENWMSSSKRMDSAGVQGVIDKLRDLASIKFLEKAQGSPVVEATVTSNDNKRVEKVVIAKQGNMYFAQRENEPSAYELDGKAVEDLQKAVQDVKEYQPPKDQKKK